MIYGFHGAVCGFCKLVFDVSNVGFGELVDTDIFRFRSVVFAHCKLHNYRAIYISIIIDTFCYFFEL